MEAGFSSTVNLFPRDKVNSVRRGGRWTSGWRDGGAGPVDSSTFIKESRVSVFAHGGFPGGVFIWVSTYMLGNVCGIGK